MGILLLLVTVCPLLWASVLQPLDPNGANVCRLRSDLASLSCCAGWRQQGSDCTIAICERESACRPGEICVRPQVCRCPHGYFGANCVTRCPEQFWGTDCRELCSCHPHGVCDAVSGHCSCRPGRWGPNCSRSCRCSHGVCEPDSGRCRCEAGWWGADCSRFCQCRRESSECDPQSGRCTCSPRWWGRRCNIRCYCGQSPCSQSTGECQCQAGWWGARCEQTCACLHGSCHPRNGHCVCQPGYRGGDCGEPCAAGTYGVGCENRCGQCKGAQPCSPEDGSCLVCEVGWTGSRCDQLCPAGSYGENCASQCPRCRDGEPCNVHTGHCATCDPGWTKPRCDTPCATGTYGAECRSSCPDCCHGTCHHVTGECICDAGYTGDSCNSSCQIGMHGVNCSMTCRCLGATCDHVTGSCPLSTAGVVTTAVLLPILLFLCLLCCCCGGEADDPAGRVVDKDSGPIARMKHHVRCVLANLRSPALCFTLGNQKLPKVTVLPHDADLTLNCSFIDSPSAVWDSDSFDTDDERPVYCTPPMEESLPSASDNIYQEPGSRCNYLPAETGEAASEERLQPVQIPRTSSVAAPKRPSVSFAEGTKFEPERRRASASEPGSRPLRKAKLSWRLSRLLMATGDPADPSPSPSPSSGHSLPAEPRASDPGAAPNSPGPEGSDSGATEGPQAPSGGEGPAAGKRPRSWGLSPTGGVVAAGTVRAALRRFGGSRRRRRAGPADREEGTLRAQPGAQEGPSAPGASGSLSRRPLIPATPVLRKLVANVVEDSGARLGVVIPITAPTQDSSPPEGQQAQDVPAPPDSSRSAQQDR
ncbi:scavenger receptor class F member 1 [Hypanus sabinus]|uniref:scavenger receptor class F member 1 n=1 Tax=Hypanus sabinus TaxID=79690 RepID=UPI0028C4DEC1|nr:scavenger receptor class F member 1 [Hypanus sabinus]